MYGRLGGMYFLHLAEASAQRRRLAEAETGSRTGSEELQPTRRPAEGGIVMFLRLAGVMAIGLAAIVALVVMVG